MSDVSTIARMVPVLANIVLVATVVAVALFVLAGLRGRPCRYCRKRNRAEAIFCAECGHRLTDRPARPES